MKGIRENEVTTKEAAERMGCTVLYVQEGLKQGELKFGTAIRIGNSNKYTFNIPRKRFESYIAGDDIQPEYVSATEFDGILKRMSERVDRWKAEGYNDNAVRCKLVEYLEIEAVTIPDRAYTVAQITELFNLLKRGTPT